MAYIRKLTQRPNLPVKRRIKLLNLILIFMFFVHYSNGQQDTIKFEKNDSFNQVELIYYYAGIICPFS